MISVSIRMGVLTNGNESIDKKQIAAGLKSMLTDYMTKSSGFDSPRDLDDDEVFRFSGAFDLTCHLMNAFCRRDWCVKSSSPYLSLVFDALNESGVLLELSHSKSCSESKFRYLLQGLAIIPIKPFKPPACLRFMKDAFSCI